MTRSRDSRPVTGVPSDSFGPNMARLIREYSSPQKRAEGHAAIDRARERHEREIDRKANRLAVLSSGIGLTDGDVHLLEQGGPFESTKAMQGARVWVNSSPRTPILALAGGTGAGKTLAAHWAALQSGLRFKAIESIEATRLASARFGPDREEWQRLIRVPLLLVDDLGTAGDDERERTMWLEVMNVRSRMATLVTTNKSGREGYADSMDRLIGPRGWSRMYQRATWVACGGNDLRVEQRKGQK